MYEPRMLVLWFFGEEVADFGEEEFFVGGWGRLRGWFGFFLFHGGDDFFYDDEDGECHENEGYGVGDELAVVESNGGDCFFALAGCHAVFECDDEVFEIDISHEESEGRHEDVIDEGFDDGGEGAADDDADGHVDEVAFESEVAEFFNHGFS
jgi:hypothetical protein